MAKETSKTSHPKPVKAYPCEIPTPAVRTRNTLLKFEQIAVCRQQGNCAGWGESFCRGILP